MADTDNNNLRLTDFMDLPTLRNPGQLTSVAKVKVTITDADGNRLTQPQPTKEFLHRQQAIEEAEQDHPGPTREGREYVAPIIVNNHRLGTIRMAGGGGLAYDESELTGLAEKFQIDPRQLKAALSQLDRQAPHQAGRHSVPLPAG